MRYWNTGDGPTDTNLRRLENWSRPWSEISSVQFVEKLVDAGGIVDMLPKAVSSYLDLPSPYIGNQASFWPPSELRRRDDELCTAIENGLVKIEADSTLKKAGGAILNDRPLTKGEQIQHCLATFKKTRNASDHSALRQAISDTPFVSSLNELDRWLERKRPSSPHRSIEYEISCAIGEISHKASLYHHHPASYGFSFD